MSQPKKPGRYRYRLRADSTWARWLNQEWRETDVLYVDGMWAGVGGSACIPILHHDWEWIGPLEKAEKPGPGG